MWDPISIFYLMYVLSIDMPKSRLSVADVIEAKETKIFVETISESVKLRDGV